MAKPNLKGLLSKPSGNFERPQALPAGDYTAVLGTYGQGTSRQKQTPFIEFPARLTGIFEDSVEEADLPAGFSFDKGRNVKARFFITDDATYILVEFLKSLGIEDDGKTVMEMLSEVSRNEVIVTLTLETSDKGETYNQVARIRGTAQE